MHLRQKIDLFYTCIIVDLSELKFLPFTVTIKSVNQIIFTCNSKNFSFKFQYTDVSTSSFYFELCIWTDKGTNCCWSILHSGIQWTTSVTWLNPVFLIIGKRSLTDRAIVFLKSKNSWPGYFAFFFCLFYK